MAWGAIIGTVYAFWPSGSDIHTAEKTAEQRPATVATAAASDAALDADEEDRSYKRTQPPEEDGATHRLKREITACDDWKEQKNCRKFPAGTKCYVSYEMLGINTRVIAKKAPQRNVGVIDCVNSGEVEDILETILSDADVTPICTEPGTPRMKGIAVCLSPQKAHRRTSHNLATHRLNRKVVACFDWAAKEKCVTIPVGTECAISGRTKTDAQKRALLKTPGQIKRYNGLEYIACDEVGGGAIVTVGAAVEVLPGIDTLMWKDDATSICTKPGQPRRNGIAVCGEYPNKDNIY
jgi:hypothetical protein